MKQYIPLVVLFFFALFFSTTHADSNSFHTGMNLFMGYFLCLLAMLKLFDISGFHTAFKKYDILTQQFPIYGYIFPFLEAFLGFGLISGSSPFITNFCILILMVVTSYSVIRYLASGKKIACACMGTSLNVPLSTVSIVETVGMGIMAFINLLLFV